MNTVALAFLVIGVVNPYVELTNSGSDETLELLNDPAKLEALGMTLTISNPGVNINWLLTSMIVYVFALLAVATAKNLEE